MLSDNYEGDKLQCKNNDQGGCVYIISLYLFETCESCSGEPKLLLYSLKCSRLVDKLCAIYFFTVCFFLNIPFTVHNIRFFFLAHFGACLYAKPKTQFILFVMLSVP